MANQAAMSGVQGNGAEPTRTMANNMSGFASDIATLAELQTKLLVTDLKESAERLVWPVVLAAVGVSFVFSCFPILLVALAYLFVEAGGMYRGWAFLLSGVLGLVLGGAILVPAWLLLRGSFRSLERTRKELSENIRWVKQALQRSGRTWSPSECR